MRFRSRLLSAGRPRPFILVLCSVAMAITALIGLPQSAQAKSTLGGKITRSEVLTRAQDWFTRNVPYCQGNKTDCANRGTPWAWDVDKTREYRPDCSGFVDMAWHLDADPATGDLDGAPWTKPIAKADLLPGDILDNVEDGHVVLFEKWYDSAHTVAQYYSEGSTETDMNHDHGPVNSGTLSGHPAANYHAYRYVNIDDGVQAPDSRQAIGHNADGRLEAFGIGGDGALNTVFQTEPNGVWGAWKSLGGQDLRSVVVGNNADGRLEVFGVGGDGVLYTIFQLQPNGDWGPWKAMGGNDLSAHLTVGSNADGRLEVFGIGGDGALYTIFQLQPNGDWGPWKAMGGRDLGGHLDVGSNADGRLEIFVVGGDGALNTIFQTEPDGVWGAWKSLGGHDLRSVVVGANADGRLEAFSAGGDGALYTTFQLQPNGDWSPWKNLG
jgi:hypothetical protein